MEGTDVRQGGAGGSPRLQPEVDMSNENLGITQRGVAQLFRRIEEMKASDTSRHYSVFVSFL